MQWVTINELQARMNPQYRLAYERQHMQNCLAQAKLEQGERHHAQTLQVQQQKMALDRELQHLDRLAQVERESIAGQNALALGRQNYMLGELAKNTELVHSMFDSQHKREEEWGNNYARIMGDLLTIEADTIRQKAVAKQQNDHDLSRLQLEHELRMREKQFDHMAGLQNKQVDFQYVQNLENQKANIQQQEQKLKHRQEIEKLVLQYNFGVLEKYLDHHLQNLRVTFDKSCEIIFRVIERMLGLGEQQVRESDIDRMVQDAMKQAYSS
jgi:hypothetical protein